MSIAAPYCLPIDTADLPRLVPYAGASSAAAALGAGIGLLLGLLMLKVGILKRSFAQWEAEMAAAEKAGQENPEIDLNIRLEMAREIGFLLPGIVLSIVFWQVLTQQGTIAAWWSDLIAQQKWLAGLLGSLFGFIIGGTVVWATRILGSLAFGREAM